METQFARAPNHFYKEKVDELLIALESARHNIQTVMTYQKEPRENILKNLNRIHKLIAEYRAEQKTLQLMAERRELLGWIMVIRKP